MQYLKYLFLGLIFITFNACQKDTGTITVTYQEAKAIYGSLDQIRSTPLIGDASEIVNPGKIHVSNDYLLIGEEEQGIHIIDDSDPESPQNISFLNIPGNREFVVFDDYIYAESYYDFLKIDISDINNPVIVDRIEFMFGEELIDDNGQTLIGFTFTEVTQEIENNSSLYNEIINGNQLFLDYAQNTIPKSALPASFSGSGSDGFGVANRISSHNGHIYVIGRNDLHILNENSFSKINHNLDWQLADEMETIFPYENHLFIGTRSSMDIIDITDGSNPSFSYRFDHATSCDPVLANEDAAYVTLRTADFSACPGNVNALIVLDIDDLKSPVLKEEIEMSSPYGMSMIDSKLYVAEGNNGLKIFDATSPLELNLLEHVVDITAYDIIKHPTLSNIILIAGPSGLSQYEVDSELSFSLKSEIRF